LAVVDGRGQLRASFLETTRTRVIPERCIQPTRTVLSEVVRSGTGHAARLERWQAYGKTGTTTGNADAWFIGWSEGRVLGVWMGKRRGATGGALAGAGAPADLFRRIATSTNEMMEYRASREAQRNKPHVTAQRHIPNQKAAGRKTPERKVAQVKEAVRVRPPSEPLQRRFVPELPPPSSWDSEFWPEDGDDFRPW
jgi:penicillin-binding protein 1A